MPEHEIFLGLAEVTIVFAGFSGISVVLGTRQTGAWSTLDAGRIATMVENSLAYALFALLPLALSGLGLRGPILWVLCSSGLAIYIASSFIRVTPRVYRYYREHPEERDSPMWIAVAFGAAPAAIVVQCLNVFAVGFERTSGPYLFGLIVGLALSARLFVRSLSVLRRALSETQE